MELSTSAPGLLVIGGDRLKRRALVVLLRKQGYPVSVAADLTTSLQILTQRPIALALVGEGADSTDIVRRIRHQSPATELVLVVEQGSLEQAAQALAAGAIDYIRSPIEDWRRFQSTIERCVAAWRQDAWRDVDRKRSRRMVALRERESFAAIKGNSPALHQLIDTIRSFAPLPDTVLILGESGVGKELVARALHGESPWREGPFLAINCAAIKADLFESELFGHRAGSFTGATRERAGLLESARGGTLFLDEVGELVPALQAKLLRVLEQREYRPVGADRIQDVDVRFVAATNVDLEAAITDNRFREDLYFRLSGLEIAVPPLRARRGDIQLLAYHFLSIYSARYERSITGITAEAMAWLEAASWERNNVRELEWTLRQAVARCENGGELRCAHFPSVVVPELRAEVPDGQRGREGAEQIAIGDLLDTSYSEALRAMRRRFAREYIERCLQMSSYNKSRAAERAGMQRSNFYRLLRELEIVLPTAEKVPA